MTQRKSIRPHANKKTTTTTTTTGGSVRKASSSKARKISPDDYMQQLEEVTKDAEQKRCMAFAKRFEATAPAPKYKITQNDNGKSVSEMNCSIEALMTACGTVSPVFAQVLAGDIMNATYSKHDVAAEHTANAALAALNGIAPKDEAEGMLAAQMVAVHHAGRKFSRGTMEKQFRQQIAPHFCSANGGVTTLSRQRRTNRARRACDCECWRPGYCRQCVTCRRGRVSRK